MSSHKQHDDEVEKTTKSMFKNSGLSTLAKTPKESKRRPKSAAK